VRLRGGKRTSPTKGQEVKAEAVEDKEDGVDAVDNAALVDYLLGDE